MALHQSFAFKRREELASFVSATLHHAEHGRRASRTETINKRCVMGEVPIQSSPLAVHRGSWTVHRSFPRPLMISLAFHKEPKAGAIGAIPDMRAE